MTRKYTRKKKHFKEQLLATKVLNKSFFKLQNKTVLVSCCFPAAGKSEYETQNTSALWRGSSCSSLLQGSALRPFPSVRLFNRFHPHFTQQKNTAQRKQNIQNPRHKHTKTNQNKKKTHSTTNFSLDLVDALNIENGCYFLLRDEK